MQDETTNNTKTLRQTSGKTSGQPALPSARRADITKAALLVLQTVGSANFTARKVAEKAQMSLGNLTYHFADMDALRLEAFRLGADQLADLIESPPQRGTMADRLQGFLTHLFSPAALDPNALRLRLDLWSSARHHPEIAAIEAALSARIRGALDTYLAAMGDQWKADRIPQVADLIMATLDGLWLDWARRGDETAINNGIEGCVHLARLRLS